MVQPQLSYGGGLPQVQNQGLGGYMQNPLMNPQTYPQPPINDDMNMYKPPLPMPAAGVPLRQEYKNISQVPPTSGVAALLHHSQGSQFQGQDDDRQKRIFFRDKERERRRLGLSAPDNYGGVKDQLKAMGTIGRPGQESFSLSRNQESPINFPVPKIDLAQPQTMPSGSFGMQPPPQYFQPQPLQAQHQYFDPAQQFQQQYPPYYPHQPQNPAFQQHPFMPNYGMPQPSYSPPPQAGYYPYQQAVPPFNPLYQQPQMPQIQQAVQPLATSTSPQGRVGNQPRQGGAGLSRSPQQHQPNIYFPDSMNPNAPQRETFFDKFGQPDNVQQTLNNGGLTALDKQRKLREELEQQIQEKKKRQEEEKIDKEKWEMKYGEGNFIAQQAKQQPPATNPNSQTNPTPFPGQQQYPGLQNQATFQAISTAQNNLNNSFNANNNPFNANSAQNRQLPGGGTTVAHGAVPQDNNNSPNRNHPSQADSYKNELMVQIEEKRKLKELERKKKMEQDEKDEMRVKKEMDDLQKRYQYEVNPNPDQYQLQNNQGPNEYENNRSDELQSAQRDQNRQQQQNANNYSYEQMGDYQNENFDSYQDQPMNTGGNQRGNYQNVNNISQQYNQQQFTKQQSRKIQVHNPKIDWNQDPTVGPDSTPQAFESQFYVPEKDNQSQNNSQQINQNQGSNPNRNRFDSFDNNSQQRLNPQQHRQQYIQKSPNQSVQHAPPQNQFQQQHQFQMQPEINNYHQANEQQQPPFFNQGPPLNVPMPPPPPNLLADFDPFKQKLQEQLSTFQKDILRMQHQQKSMMKNYHKEIEQLQVKKQQIIYDMKNDQDIQMKMQIQQLSSAISQLSMKMSNKDNPQHQRYNSYSPPPPNKSEIVAEVIQELKNVLPIPLQPLQYNQPQYSQSQSPPPQQQFNPYQQNQYQSPPQFQNQAAFVNLSPAPQSFHSELPQQLQLKKGPIQNNIQSAFAQKQQKQHPYLQQTVADVQLPSTTIMMPHHESPEQKRQQQQQHHEVRTIIEEQETPIREIPHLSQMIPHDHSVSFNQQSPQIDNHKQNNAKVNINITLPHEITSHKQSLIQKAKEIKDHKISILEEAEDEQLPDPIQLQKRRNSVIKDINIQMPHEVESHKTMLLEKAKQIHLNTGLPTILESEDNSQGTSQKPLNMPKRRQSSVMQMPMMEVLQEDVEHESQQESEQEKPAEAHSLAIPTNKHENIIQGRRKSVVAALDANIHLPLEISSHKSQLLEKAKQIHDHIIPDRSSLTSSSLDIRKKIINQEDMLVRQSSQFSQQPILESLEEEEQESVLSSQRSQNLKKKLTNPAQLKLLSQKIMNEPLNSENQQETPREEKEKMMERIRLKNKKREEKERILNETFVKEEPPTSVALKIDKGQRQSLNNSENGSQNEETNKPVIQVPPVVLKSRDIGTSIPGQRRGLGKNSQQFPKSQIPRIPKPTSSTVLHEEIISQHELNYAQHRNKLQNDLINEQAQVISQEALNQAMESARRRAEVRSNKSGKSSQQVVRASKINNQAYSEALDSIKQVQIDLEARNIIGSNPIQRVNQRVTKPTTPNEILEFGPKRLVTENLAPAVLPISQKHTSQNNYTQEEFYEQLPPNDGSADQQFYSEEPMFQQVDNFPIQNHHQHQMNEDIMQQMGIPQYPHQYASQVEMMQVDNYYPIPLNRSLAIHHQQAAANMHQVQNQYSPSQISMQRQSQANPVQRQIEIPNPPLVYQDEYGNFVNFVPDSFNMNGENNYYQNPLVTQSFQMIQRNPYQAQYPLNQQRPVVQQDYDYNEEFQHLAKEDSRMPTPIESQPTTDIIKTPKEEEKQIVQTPVKHPIIPQKSEQKQPQVKEVQYQMIVSADSINQIINPVIEFEGSSEEKVQKQIPLQKVAPKKQAVQPMQIPPWRTHLNAQPEPANNLTDQPQPQQNNQRNAHHQPPEIQGYNTEDTVQYRIEQQQNVLEQELLYDQLMQYERQHLQEVQEYMQQQQAAREQLIEPYNQNVTESQEGVPKQLMFPDFTGFLYNKFLVNGPSVGYVPYVKEPQLKLDTPTRKIPSPRTKFMMQLQNTPSYTLVSRDPSLLLPEPPQPPTQLIMNNIVNKGLDTTSNQNASHMMLPRTPSHMMRPVTQAPPRRQDDEPNVKDEQKQFLMQIDQIQQIVGEYESMKKDIEYERMIQEQNNIEQMSKDYLKSLQKVELLVNEKQHLKMRKSYDQESFNIGDESSQDQLSPSNKQQMLMPPRIQMKQQNQNNRSQSNQGQRPYNPANLIPEAAPLEEDTMKDMSQSIYPQSQMQQMDVPVSHGDRDDQFSRQLSDQLNIADGSLVNETIKHDRQDQQKHHLPDINGSKPQTGVKFLRDMLKQVPSIPLSGGGYSTQQSRNKPPLPPINTKSASLNVPMATNRSDLNSSSYIPRHILNNPGFVLPPIRQASQHSSSNREFDGTSLINLGNDDSNNNINNNNLLQLKPLNRNSSSLSDLFESLPQPKAEYNKEDPFALRDRLKQTLQETGQILRNENITLLQKVQEAGKSIKPSYYEQGLPPIIDLAQRDIVHLSQPMDYAPRPSNMIQIPDPIQSSHQDYMNSLHPQSGSFSNNFQQWDMKRAMTKTTEERYNIVRSSGASVPEGNPYQNIELVREMMQLRNIQQQQMLASQMKRQNQPPKITQAPSPKIMTSSLKILPNNTERNPTQSLAQPITENLQQNPQVTINNSSEQVKYDDSIPTLIKLEQTQQSIIGSLVETKPLPTNFVQSPIHEHHSEYSHNGFSSNYDDVSRINDSNEKIVYKVVEHIVESPKNLFGVELKPQADPVRQTQVSNAAQNQQQQTSIQEKKPQHDDFNSSIATTTPVIQSLPLNGASFTGAAVNAMSESGDLTQQNVKNDRNIGLEEETANVWVSRWFNQAQASSSSGVNQAEQNLSPNINK